MKYNALARLYESLESTTLRLKKTYILADFIEKNKDDELDKIVLLADGRVFPEWSSKEMGIASSLTIQAISKAYGISSSKVEDKWKELGDLGLVAGHFSGKNKQSTLFSRSLDVSKVFNNLVSMVDIEGRRSQEKKIDRIIQLLKSTDDPIDARYIIRTVIGDLRVGVSNGIIRDAITYAFFANIYWKETLLQRSSKSESNQSYTRISRIAEDAKDKKIYVSYDIEKRLISKDKESYYKIKENNDVEVVEEDTLFSKDPSKSVSGIDMILSSDSKRASELKSKIIDSVDRAFNMTNDFSSVATAARDGGLNGLSDIELTLNHPVKVMLFQKAMNISDGFRIVGKPAEIEYKYDGFRLQIHKTGSDGVRLFTRRLEDVTSQFPDVVSYVGRAVKSDNFILDCEVVGLDRSSDRYLPFQKISTRIKQKHNVSGMSEEVPVAVIFFDTMMIDGKDMIDVPFIERREAIEKVVDQESIPNVRIADHIITDDVKETKDFYKRSLDKGNEGIMMKKLDAPYKPGSRVGYGIKIKPTMDNLDLAIVGAEYGEGKRTGWFSSFYLACYDPDEGRHLIIGKLGTGIKEKSEEGITFKKLTERLKEHIVEEKGKHVKLKPDIVLEVAYEEIQKSPKYESGFALRFPRLVRLRDDRTPEDASSIEEIKMIYKSQRGRDSL